VLRLDDGIKSKATAKEGKKGSKKEKTTLVVCQAKDCEFEGKWRGYSLPQQIS
jgi:hypothetical protein